jgi:flagellar hook-associated protein 2
MAINLSTGTASSSSTAGITTPSIDVSGIVSQLISAEQQPITGMNNQISSYQAKISALGSIQSALSQFETAVQGLNSTAFDALSATASNGAVLSASASSTAKSGNYAVTVSQLAQAQSLAAAGQASSTTAIGSGAQTTLTFDFGTISGGTLSNGNYSGATFTSNGNGTKSITIDSSNNTLQGIADAINAANIGVTASIINDGSASPYRLVLADNRTGASNSMKIAVSGDATLTSLLTEDPAGSQGLTQTAAAQNASMTINGIPVSSASNAVTNAIQGLTLNLAATTVTPITLSVAPNSTAATQAINNFVTAYNGVVAAIQNQTSYDATTKTAGTLQGDISLSILQSQLASMLTTNIGSNPNGLSSLSQIGLGLQQNGTLALNGTTFSNALNSNYQGVASLFVAAGTATDSLVSYSAATSNTKPGNYGINVSQLASQGTAVGNAAAGLTITGGSNDTLNLAVDGVSTSVVLPAGTYTAASLATQLQTLINASTPISTAGKSVAVTQNAGMLTVTSGSYGSSSSVVISGGNGATNLFGTPTQTAGVDVAGTINGLAASGSGQLLTSTAGDSRGLAVLIQGGITGNRGVASYSPGIASMFDTLVTSMLSKNGAISSETAQYNSEITSVQNQINTLNAQIAVDQANLTNQYSQLDATLGTMNELSSYLTQQLSNLP